MIQVLLMIGLSYSNPVNQWKRQLYPGFSFDKSRMDYDIQYIVSTVANDIQSPSQNVFKSDYIAILQGKLTQYQLASQSNDIPSQINILQSIILTFDNMIGDSNDFMNQNVLRTRSVPPSSMRRIISVTPYLVNIYLLSIAQLYALDRNQNHINEFNHAIKVGQHFYFTMRGVYLFSPEQNDNLAWIYTCDQQMRSLCLVIDQCMGVTLPPKNPYNPNTPIAVPDVRYFQYTGNQWSNGSIPMSQYSAEQCVRIQPPIPIFGAQLEMNGNKVDSGFLIHLYSTNDCSGSNTTLQSGSNAPENYQAASIKLTAVSP